MPWLNSEHVSVKFFWPSYDGCGPLKFPNKFDSCVSDPVNFTQHQTVIRRCFKRGKNNNFPLFLNSINYLTYIPLYIYIRVYIYLIVNIKIDSKKINSILYIGIMASDVTINLCDSFLNNGSPMPI